MVQILAAAISDFFFDWNGANALQIIDVSADFGDRECFQRKLSRIWPRRITSALPVTSGPAPKTSSLAPSQLFFRSATTSIQGFTRLICEHSLSLLHNPRLVSIDDFIGARVPSGCWQEQVTRCGSVELCSTPQGHGTPWA